MYLIELIFIRVNEQTHTQLLIHNTTSYVCTVYYININHFVME